MEDLGRVVAVLALVGANAFFVVGEYAVVTARRSALTPRAEAGSPGAAAALRLMADPVRVISTVQVGITALGILTGAIGEPIVRDLLGEAIPTWAGFLIAFSAVTYLSVVMGELVPKAVTLQRSEQLAILVAPPIDVIGRILHPLVVLLQASARLILRPLGIDDVVAGDSIRSASELRTLVDEAEGAGIIPRAQEELIYNVFDFASKEAADVMVPAAEVDWVDASTPARDAVAVFRQARHERLPVGEGGLDRVVGILRVQDLLEALEQEARRPVREAMRPVVIVPETKDLGALLREMRERREHMVVVASEYGTTSGIVTLNDVLEEIVGEIESEYELPDAQTTRLPDGTVDVPGSISVDDFNQTLGTRLPTDGARTIAGVVFDALGRRPEPGDEVTVESVALRVRVVEGARITRINARIADVPG